MAKEFAVLGSPIQHSKSPTIHLAAYQALGLDWNYERFEVDKTNFDAFLSSRRLDGASLTMPLKEIAFERFGSVNEAGELARAVNTLVHRAGTFEAYNTDVFGLEKALEECQFDSTMILGSGATARNSLIALSRMNPGSRASIVARNGTAAEHLVEFGNSLGLVVSAGNKQLAAFDLVISTLPPMVAKQDIFKGDPRGTLLDVAYNPWPSELALHWGAFGGNVVSGLEMLIWQAIAQIRIFKNGNDAEPLDDENELARVMRQAAND
jgi:shikimate dehydrogenase